MKRRSLLLGGLGAVAAGVLAVPQATAAPNQHPSSFSSISGEDAGPDDVHAVQYLLLRAGITQPVFYPTYTRAVYESVRTFQKARGLTVTGRCDANTLAALCVTVQGGDRSYAVTALDMLLDKHGYRTHTSTLYGTQTDRDVRGLQAGHALPQEAYVDIATWKVLFGPVTSGPMFPMMQEGTGAAQWANCGPTSLCMVLLNRGKIPAQWNGLTADRSAAVQALRYTAMHLANTASRNSRGTEFPDLNRGLSHYGLSSWHGGIASTLAYARAGKSSIAGGNAYALSWNRGSSSYVHGPVSHWVAVLGYDGSRYLVGDPIATPSNDVIHRVTEQELRTYASTNPGWYPGHPTMSPPWQNSVLVR
ncbi:peptidoglycan-binding protein [Leekyejoonella antrihumi]|nr:peptidoglycan-binding protein [Leekyejoonella antrihumi]